MIYFVDDVGPSPLAQSVGFRDLPLRDVGQHSFLLLPYFQRISTFFFKSLSIKLISNLK